MYFIPTELPDVVLIKPKVWNDSRGFLLESWNEREFHLAGLDVHFRQDNYSRSLRNVVRGIHYQLHQPQGKLIRCTRGAIFDVAVDLRRNSNTFRRWVGAELSELNHQMLWIPPGFGHGFLVVSDEADVHYKASELYDAASDRVVLWNDPQLAIEWPLAETPFLSTKDAGALSLDNAELFD